VQECLTNVHRHSGSLTASVRLLRSPGQIKLEVSDEGKGLSKETQSKIACGETVGVGLRGMQERVRQLGGSVEIWSNGRGTRVTATVPFEESGQGVAISSAANQQRCNGGPSETKDDVTSTTVVPLAGKAAKA
jgi:signal transduction histidine kinase